MVINGSTIVKKYKHQLIAKFKKLNFKPKLAIIVLNGLENQKDYLQFKTKFAASLGVETIIYNWSDLTTEQCLKELKKIADDPTINGIIPQLPANPNIHVNILLENIPLLKDVDGLNPKQFDKKHPFVGASNVFILQTIAKVDFFKNKIILIIGRNPYFAQPLYRILKSKHHQVWMIRYGEYAPWMAKAFDIIVSAVNQPLFINANKMRKGSIGIDLTYYKPKHKDKPVGAFYGDINHLKYFTPVPGGLGPITVYNLFHNLYQLIKLQNKKPR